MAPEFFQMCVASNKINLAEKYDCNRVSDVNAEELWKISQKEMVPMHEYWDWIKGYLLDVNGKKPSPAAAAQAKRKIEKADPTKAKKEDTKKDVKEKRDPTKDAESGDPPAAPPEKRVVKQVVR